MSKKSDSINRQRVMDMKGHGEVLKRDIKEDRKKPIRVSTSYFIGTIGFSKSYQPDIRSFGEVIKDYIETKNRITTLE